MYFSYGEKETAYLKSKDRKLGEVIEQLGPIRRPADTDLFSSVVHQGMKDHAPQKRKSGDNHEFR